MKNHRKQPTDIMEKIESIIAGIEPGKVVSIDDIAAQASTEKLDATTKRDIIMLLKKYGVGYKL